MKPLVSTIELFLRHPPPGESGNRVALIAATVRNKDTLQAFVDTCCKSMRSCLLVCIRLGTNGKSLYLMRTVTMPLSLETIDLGREHVPTVFWNASTWEGSEVRLMRITLST